MSGQVGDVALHLKQFKESASQDSNENGQAGLLEVLVLRLLQIVAQGYSQHQKSQNYQYFRRYVNLKKEKKSFTCGIRQGLLITFLFENGSRVADTYLRFLHGCLDLSLFAFTKKFGVFFTFSGRWWKV